MKQGNEMGGEVGRELMMCSESSGSAPLTCKYELSPNSVSMNFLASHARETQMNLITEHMFTAPTFCTHGRPY